LYGSLAFACASLWIVRGPGIAPAHNHGGTPAARAGGPVGALVVGYAPPDCGACGGGKHFVLPAGKCRAGILPAGGPVAAVPVSAAQGFGAAGVAVFQPACRLWQEFQLMRWRLASFSTNALVRVSRSCAWGSSGMIFSPELAH